MSCASSSSVGTFECCGNAECVSHVVYGEFEGVHHDYPSVEKILGASLVGNAIRGCCSSKRFKRMVTTVEAYSADATRTEEFFEKFIITTVYNILTNEFTTTVERIAEDGQAIDALSNFILGRSGSLSFYNFITTRSCDAFRKEYHDIIAPEPPAPFFASVDIVQEFFEEITDEEVYNLLREKQLQYDFFNGPFENRTEKFRPSDRSLPGDWICPWPYGIPVVGEFMPCVGGHGVTRHIHRRELNTYEFSPFATVARVRIRDAGGQSFCLYEARPYGLRDFVWAPNSDVRPICGRECDPDWTPIAYVATTDATGEIRFDPDSIRCKFSAVSGCNTIE